jgi:GTPase Era involved in 16S rRNA processing
MSAGKSTLINALLGKKLMPSKAGACTATITRIQDNDDPNYKATVYDESGSEIGHYPELDYKTMVGLNKDKDTSKIEVLGDIPFVKSDEVSLVLIDTPGPDNAEEKKHGLVTAKALDQSSKMLVLFVMNGGKLHDVAQDDFLRRIAKSMSVGGKQSRERFLFVINKMDDYNDEDDDIKGETIPGTIKYLEEMGIENPNIFPASAQTALLIRRYLKCCDEEEKNKLWEEVQSKANKLVNHEQLHLEQYAKLPRSCQEKIDGELEIALSEGDILGQALVHSGIRGIEETIRMYVTKYSMKPIFLEQRMTNQCVSPSNHTHH